MKLKFKNLFKGDRYIPKKYSYPFFTILVFVLIGYFINTGLKIAASKMAQINELNIQNEQMATQQTPMPSPTDIPTPEPMPVETYDPDPVITCIFRNIPSRKMRNSACLKSTECEIGDKWTFYASKDQCIKDQNAAAPTPPPNNGNTVTKKEVEQMLIQKEVEAANRQLKNDAYSNCLANARIEADRCFKECGEKNSFNSNACDAAYLNGGNYNSELYQQCNSERRAENTACNDKCFEINNRCKY